MNDGEKKSYFLMWGVSQMFYDVQPGSYLGKASLTIRNGSWTGTLQSGSVPITLPSLL